MTERPRIPPIRVMIVDDHPLVRAGLRQTLHGHGIEIVAEASSAEEALLLAPETRPNVLIVDISLPGIDGVRLVRDLAPRLPETRIVMLTVSSSDRHVLEAIRYGAAGYLTKDLSPEALARAIRGAHAGELAMSRTTASRLLRRLAGAPGPPRDDEDDPGLIALSDREADVLRLLTGGLSDREVAQSLAISVRTVETHVSSILRKTGARNRAEAARLYRDKP